MLVAEMARGPNHVLPGQAWGRLTGPGTVRRKIAVGKLSVGALGGGENTDPTEEITQKAVNICRPNIYSTR